LAEIELSYMVGSLDDELLPVQEFERQTLLSVRHTRIKWDNAWGDVLRMALHQHGPDVSEIGSTWMGSLSDMQALKPFDESSINHLGGEKAFAPSLWQACTVSENNKILAIPWYLDLRFILYRRDILASAGVDEKTAFQDAGAFHETLKKLSEHGIKFPLLMPTANRFIHTAASWVWGAGGDLRSADGTRMAIQEPAARKGLVEYFNLHHFIAPEVTNLIERDTIKHFYSGEGAIVLGSDSHYFRIKKGLRASPVVRENLGIAPYPGIPLIGGGNLVVWRHTINKMQSLELINYLTDFTTAKFIFDKYQILPARVKHFSRLINDSEPIYKLLLNALATGRSLRSHFHWAGVETRLNYFFSQMWQDLFKNPEINLEAEIEKRLVEVSTHLDHTILASAE
jgi:multiple sugar transport system substrate-binding protein